jgi:hypothetical protein
MVRWRSKVVLAIAAVLMTAGLSAAPIGAAAAAATAAPPAAPLVTNIQVIPSKGLIFFTVTHCHNCRIRVAWNYGASSRYPRSFHASKHRQLFGPVQVGFPLFFGRSAADLPTQPGPYFPDRTTLHVSVWAWTSAGGYSKAVHRSVKVGEFVAGLSPSFVGATLDGPHTVSLDIRTPANTGEVRGIAVYARKGLSPINLLAPPRPHGRPTAGYTNQPARTHHVVIKGLKDLHYYHFYVYGYDARGHSRGHYSVAILVRATGYYVTGLGRIGGIVGADMVLDRHGEVHVVGVDSQEAGKPLVYLTRKRGAAHWTRRVVAGSKGVATSAVIQLSPDGKQVVVHAHGCRGDFSTGASVAATRLPAPQLVGSGDLCVSGEDDPTGFQYVDSAPLSHGKDIVIGQDAYTNAFDLLIGRPGHTYTEQPPLADVAGVFPEAVVRDPVTGDVTVVGARQSSGTSNFAVWSQQPGQAWTGPVIVNTVEEPGLASLVAMNGNLYLGYEDALQKPCAASTDCDRLIRPLIITRDASGQWSQPEPLPHTGPGFVGDGVNSVKEFSGPALQVNPVSGTLHALYGQVDPPGCGHADCGGIRSEQLVDGHWSKPVRRTTTSLDEVSQFEISAKGQPVIGYEVD